MALKLITETIEDVEYITESKEEGGKKNYLIRGPFMQSEMKNRNGRWYPAPILEREVNRYCKDYVDTKRAFGELGHPDSPAINLERVSHMISKLERNGNMFIGEARVLETPYGMIVRNLIDAGARLGVSSRGLGSLVNKAHGKEVQEDFFLATPADIVADPSAPSAFVDGIVEGKEYIWNNGILEEHIIADMHKQIKQASKAELYEAKLRVFADFLKLL